MSEHDESEFRAWLGEDTHHAVAYRQAELLWQGSSRLQTIDFGSDQTLSPAAIWRRRSTRRGALAACGALFVGAVAVEITRDDPSLDVFTSANAKTLETRRGQIRHALLRDGTRIVLDTESKVILPEGAGARAASLVAGRARFEIVPHGGEPFTVSTPDGRVAAKAGTLDVERVGRETGVSAFGGSAVVTSEDRAQAATMLVSGYRTTIGRPGSSSFDMAVEGQWVRGMVALNGAPLATAIAAINRYNQRQVVLGDLSLGQLRVSGAFRASDPDGFAAAIATLFHLRVSRRDRDHIILLR